MFQTPQVDQEDVERSLWECGRPGLRTGRPGLEFLSLHSAAILA